MPNGRYADIGETYQLNKHGADSEKRCKDGRYYWVRCFLWRRCMKMPINKVTRCVRQPY